MRSYYILSCSQVGPVNFPTHWHLKVSSTFSQMASFLQGSLLHGRTEARKKYFVKIE